MAKWNLFFLFCLLLSGCRVHDRIDCCYPPVEMPDSYLGEKEGVAHDPEWWREFESEGLNEVMNKALCKNLDIWQAWNRLAQADSQAVIAGSERFPQIGIANQYQYTDIEGSSGSAFLGGGGIGEGSISGFGGGSTNRYLLTPSLSYEVDIWQRVCSRYRAAEWEAAATYEDVLATGLVVSGVVADTWFTIQEQLSLLEVLQYQIEVSKTLLDLVEARFAVGLSSALDVYQQRLQLANTESAVPPVKQQLEISNNRLYVLTAEPPEALMRENNTEILESLPPFPALGSPMDLVYARPDLRAEYKRLRSADEEVAAAIADRFPKLTLLLNYQFSTTTLKQLFEQEFFFLLADLMTPVIDGGRRRAEVARRKAIVCERLNSFSQVFLNALEEVDSAIASEKYQLELLEKVDEQIDLAEQNLRQARLRYANGLNDYLTVITAVQSLQALQRERVTVRKQLLENRAALYRALGGFCL